MRDERPVIDRWRRVMAAAVVGGVLPGLVAAAAGAGPVGEFEVADVAAMRPAVRERPPRTFLLVAGGDIVPEIPVLDSAAAAGPAAGVRYDFDPMFAPVTPLIREADLAICHLETPVGAPGERPGLYGRTAGGAGLLLSPHELVGDLRDAGFDRCSTASNHSNDFGSAGIATTLDVLDAHGLGHAGTARSPAESDAPRLVEVGGVTVAHLAYSRYSNTAWPAEPWRIATAPTVASVAADVARARTAGAEVVVVSIHVLKEQEPEPIEADRRFVTDLTAATTIELVVEHGPHVVQPVERVNGTWVYWSVGNFVSGMGRPGATRYGPRTLDGVLARVRFLERDGGGFDVLPESIAICNEATVRTVYPAAIALADPALDPGVRPQLEACLARTRVVIPDAA